MRIVVFAMLLMITANIVGCGGSAVPNGAPPPPPPPGAPGGDDDPNGGVGFDDPSMGKDGA
ncbi:MAG: hypothetical protein KDA91_10040 [Planctomycetaceae bacterium]|nr:hypothetical protein [Planctomycetaceae bacterium]